MLRGEEKKRGEYQDRQDKGEESDGDKQKKKVRWAERTTMKCGSNDGVTAGGGRESGRLPWRGSTSCTSCYSNRYLILLFIRSPRENDNFRSLIFAEILPLYFCLLYAPCFIRYLGTSSL